MKVKSEAKDLEALLKIAKNEEKEVFEKDGVSYYTIKPTVEGRIIDLAEGEVDQE